MPVVLLHRRPPGCRRLGPVLHWNLCTLELLGFPGFLGAGPDVLQPDLLDLMVLGKPGGTIGGLAPQMMSDGAAATGAKHHVEIEVLFKHGSEETCWCPL